MTFTTSPARMARTWRSGTKSRISSSSGLTTRATISPRATSSPTRLTRSDTTPAKGARRSRARELLVGLREQARARRRDPRPRGRGWPAPGRSCKRDTARARRAQALDLALEALQVHLRAGRARGLFGAGEPQLGDVYVRDHLVRLDLRARLGDAVACRPGTAAARSAAARDWTTPVARTDGDSSRTWACVISTAAARCCCCACDPTATARPMVPRRAVASARIPVVDLMIYAPETLNPQPARAAPRARRAPPTSLRRDAGGSASGTT